MNIFQIIALIFCIVSIVKIFTDIVENNFKITTLIFWITIWLAGVIIILFPQISSLASKVLGIGRGADVIIYSAIILILYLVYKLYNNQEKQSQKIKKIATRIALEKAVKNGKTGADDF